MATLVAGTSSAPELAELQKRLAKKAEFEGAVRQLQQHAANGAAPALSLMPLADRVHVLLRTRYTAAGLWRAGQELWMALLVHHEPALGDADAARLRRYLSDAVEVLYPPEEEAEARLTLGELLLGLPPPQARPSHLSDAGLVLEEPLLQTAHVTGAQQAPAADGDADAASVAAAAQLQAALQDGNRAELEALLASLTDGGDQPPRPSAPPASRKVVASLPIVALDNAQLQRLGGPGTRCPVCAEDLAVGDEVQVLPCKHAFHPPCVAPWLAGNNSCPTCRHELPTDDMAYEARKERAKEDEAEQRGAANALSHNEFMYT